MAIMATCGCRAIINGLIPDDPRWECLKAAEDATTNQQYDLAETYYFQVIKENNNQKFDVSMIYWDLNRIYFAQGRYADAIVAYRKHKLLRGEKELSNLLPIDVCLAQGKFDDALKSIQYLMKYANEHVDQMPNKADHNAYYRYADLGSYYTQIGEHEKAIQYLKIHLEVHLRSDLLTHVKGQAKNRLAMAYYYAGDDRAAEKLFRDAAGLNAGAFVVFEADLAKSLTMLGRIEEHRGAGDMALKAYQSANDVLNNGKVKRYPGIYRVEQADVQNQIGRFYVKQGKPEEAAKAYHEAMQLRQSTVTQTHPNCADAIKGLADIAAFKNELTSATLEAQAALKVLDTALVSAHPRIAPTLVALASLDALAGHPEQAAPLNARLETILQKPLGPWKEDFLETTAFYAGLLKKAGKRAEAGNLEALQVRQKERR